MGKNDPIIIRGVALIFDIVALSLVAAGAEGCFSDGCTQRMNINTWKDFRQTGGQYFVFVFSFLLIIATVVVSILAMRNLIKQKSTLIVFDAVAAVFCLLFAGLEIYYGCVWVPEYAMTDEEKRSVSALEVDRVELYYSSYTYNQSWLAAIAFYLLSSSTYGILAVLNHQ